MEIKEALCTGSDRYRANDPLRPEGVVLHSVGTPQPSAGVFVKLWQQNRSPYFTHYVLDDKDIYRTMPHDRKCWHVGSPGNGKWLGIEMCEPDTIRYTGGATFRVLDPQAAADFAAACYRNAVELLAKLCAEYGWDPESAILTHAEITEKKLSATTHADPEHLWDGLGLPYSLSGLRRDVRAAMAGESEPTAPEPPSASGASSGAEAKKSPDPARSFDRSLAGEYEVTADFLNIRTGAGTEHPILTAAPEGTKVRNYGYYTAVSGSSKWLYVAFLQNGNPVEGFCNSRYLRKR